MLYKDTQARKHLPALTQVHAGWHGKQKDLTMLVKKTTPQVEMTRITVKVVVGALPRRKRRDRPDAQQTAQYIPAEKVTIFAFGDNEYGLLYDDNRDNLEIWFDHGFDGSGCNNLILDAFGKKLDLEFCHSKTLSKSMNEIMRREAARAEYEHVQREKGVNQ